MLNILNSIFCTKVWKILSKLVQTEISQLLNPIDYLMVITFKSNKLDTFFTKFKEYLYFSKVKFFKKKLKKALKHFQKSPIGVEYITSN